MKYSEYYKIKESQLSERDILLFKEMSLQIDAPNYSDLTDNFFKPEYVEQHLKHAKFLEKRTFLGTEFSIYKWFSYLLFISEEGYMAARIEFEKHSKGITMTSIEVARPYKGLMREIFLNYLLPKYKTIESDTVQTVNAFLFYKKLAIESLVDKNFTMYIKHGNSLTQITDPGQMEKTYGKKSEYAEYSYVLKIT